MQIQHRDKMHFIHFDDDSLHVCTYLEFQSSYFE